MTDEGAQLLEDLMRFRPEDVSPNAWAVRAGVSRTIWSDLRRHGNPSRRTLEKLLLAAGSSLAEFEALRIGRTPPAPEPNANIADPRSSGWRGAPLQPIPIVEATLAGAWGEEKSGIELIELRRRSVCGHVIRPASMAYDSDAYALVNPGKAMWPRFRPGRILLVSPAAPVNAGDDVLVQLRSSLGRDDAVQALARELVRRTSSFVELRQFHPDTIFRVRAADVAALHKVMGEAI